MWRFSDSIEPYAERVWDLLASAPEANTIALTVIDGIRAGRRWSDEPPVFGWLELDDGSVGGAVSMTPPFGLLLSVVPEASGGGLVAQLTENGVAVPEVHGEEAIAVAFAREWTAGSRARSEEVMRQRLYSLGDLNPPARIPAGHSRLATLEDLDLIVGWLAAFQHETGGHEIDRVEETRGRIEQGTIRIFVSEDGTPASMAGRRAASAGVARIGPVYTPPEMRRRGFAAKVTVDSTQDALDKGAEAVVLFADLSNPVSNSIYQSIGYRPVADRVVVRFLAQVSA